MFSHVQRQKECRLSLSLAVALYRGHFRLYLRAVMKAEQTLSYLLLTPIAAGNKADLVKCGCCDCFTYPYL